jgi:outer membrane lipoprotein carrier protein
MLATLTASRYTPAHREARMSRLFALLTLLVISPATAAPAAPTPQQVIAEVKAAYAGTNSLRAEFVQVVKSKATGKEVREKGRIEMERPRKLRVEMGTPTQQLMVTDGTSMWVYSVKDKVAAQMPDLGQASSAGVVLEDLSRIDEVFNVEIVPGKNDRHVVARLTPRQAGPFASLVLTFNRKKYELDALQLTSAMGDVTEMRFNGVRTNQDIPDANFTFTPPAGVSVTKAGP